MTEREIAEAFGRLRVLSSNVIGFRCLCYDDGPRYDEAARVQHFAHFVSASSALAEAVIELGEAISAMDDRS